MADHTTQDMFGESASIGEFDSAYILTSVRQLLRILDIGLIVPELVAEIEGNVAIFNAKNLPALWAIGGYPPVAVLLELKPGANKLQSVYPASCIKTIHFSSKDQLEDYKARGFENVPNSLFTFAVTPSLFEKDVQSNIAASLPKLDRKVLLQNYRQYDVLAGILWNTIARANEAEELLSLIQGIAAGAEAGDIPAALNFWIGQESKAAGLSLDDRGLFGVYLFLLSERDTTEGWVPADELGALVAKLPSSIADSEHFRKWYRYSKAVISNEKELGTLTDDGDVLMRAILLHLLNPDAESIERMAMRDSAPGPNVVDMALSLAAARSGFAALRAELKLERPGAFWLISEITAAFINKTSFEINELRIDGEPSLGSSLLWHDELVGKLPAPTQHKIDDEVDGIQEKSPVYLLLSDVQQIALKLKEVESASIAEGLLTLVLTKEVSQPLPKQAVFTIKLQWEWGAVLSCCLLDLAMSSHKAKMTAKRMHAALAYQTEQGIDFRFEMLEEKHFLAQIIMSQQVNEGSLKVALLRLIDCHVWMKEKI
jgi:hypothetical protein